MNAKNFDANASLARMAAAGTAGAANDLRLLFIEDVPADYELMLLKLRSSGLQFAHMCIDSESSIIPAMVEFRPTIVLSDFTLQGFDGLRVLDLVREIDKHVPFIVVTGSLPEQMAFEAVKRGATDYVLKDKLDRLPVVIERARVEELERTRLQLAKERVLIQLRERQKQLPADVASRKYNIVMLEDELFDVELVKAELTSAGVDYSLHHCDDEESFRNALRSYEPDVLLVDFQLPTFDGVGALQVRDSLAPDVPFVFLSGVIGEDIAIEAVKAGATDYVLKHNLFALPTAIRRAVEAARDRKMRIEAEKILATSEITQVIAENMAAALFVVDEEGRCIFANPSAERLTGYSFEEMRDTNFHDRFHLIETSLNSPASQCPLHATHVLRNHIRRQEEMLIAKDGTVIDVLYSSTGITSGGKFNGAVIECIDISAEKAAQRMSLTVQGINDELQTLAEIVSHELQEHVGKIRSYLNLLTVRYSNRLGSDANDFMRICLESANVIYLMTDDLWTYARINKLDLERRYVDCSKVIAGTVEDFRDHCKNMKATIDYEKLPPVYSNERQVSYLFRSLIDNALKFHGQEAPHIKVRAEERDSMWVFAVEDNGPGIDPIYSKDVFKLFFKLDGKPGIGGTGMGLAICKKIVERNNGDIWFENNTNGGCTFYFSLPSHIPRE